MGIRKERELVEVQFEVLGKGKMLLPFLGWAYFLEKEKENHIKSTSNYLQ